MNSAVAAVVWAAGEPFVVQEVQVDPPKSMEVRVKILFTSICHSDLSAWLGEVTPPSLVLSIYQMSITVLTKTSVL